MISRNRRILIAAGLFAGGSILACPAVGAGAAIATLGTMAAAASVNHLTTDIHDLINGSTLNSLANHHLQELVGRALVVCIECYEKKTAPPKTLKDWIPFLCQPDDRMKALVKASQLHWDKLALAGESASLTDGQIHKAFFDRDRTATDPLISADEWDRHLADLAVYAETPTGDAICLREADRKPLAEYVAVHFALACRELVKADLDPSVGTGGRVFVALHLDLMRALSVSIKSLDTKADQTLATVTTIQSDFSSLRDEIRNKLSDQQSHDCHALLLRLDDAIRASLASLHAKADAIKHDTGTLLERQQQQATRDDIVALREEMRLVREALADKTPGTQPDGAPAVAPEVMEAARKVERNAEASLLERTEAAIVARSDDAPAYLDRLDQMVELANYKRLQLRGDYHYFRGEFDLAITPYEQALALRPDDITARNNAAIAHSRARFGDIGAHRRRAIGIFEETLQSIPQASSNWATMQNNLGNAWRKMPAGDKIENHMLAIAAYEAALTVHTRAAHPADWAMTQNNLGNLWQTMPTGAKIENHLRAIAAYEAALTVYTKTAYPAEWATTQNNLGNGWQSMPTGQKTENLERAIKAYESALTVRIKAAHPASWARTLKSLGVALADLADQPGQDRCGLLRRAIACSNGALTVFTPEAFPREHASTMHNLSIDRRAYEAGGCDKEVPFDQIPPAD